MSKILFDTVKRLDVVSGTVLADFISERMDAIRFFSYGSNMNEKDFESEMKKQGYKLSLEKAEKRVLLGYRRALDNKSTTHGLACSIHRHKLHRVEGICHDVPIKAIGAFASKEGLFNWRPKYKLIKVKVEREQEPVLSLEGLSKWSWEKVGDLKKQKVLEYVKTSLEGARIWKADIEYFERLKTNIEHKLSNKLS
jgi:hypothetical protein